MISKKGQGLSINVIIIAAIALFVLVILVFLVGRTGESFSGSTDCVQKGGTCKDFGTCENTVIRQPELCDDGFECCRLLS